MPWNIANDLDQVSQHGKRYLLDVAHFIRNQSIKVGKICRGMRMPWLVSKKVHLAKTTNLVEFSSSAASVGTTCSVSEAKIPTTHEVSKT